jgi:hypothetical protein
MAETSRGLLDASVVIDHALIEPELTHSVVTMLGNSTATASFFAEATPSGFGEPGGAWRNTT